MRLTQTCDYALRTLMYSATFSHRLVTIQEVADQYNISKNHVMKVVYELGKYGYLESVRGRGGGFRLARPMDDINVGEVVRTMEPFELVECFGEGRCVIAPACDLRGVLNEAMLAFLHVLDRYTIADLVVNRTNELALLLGAQNPTD
ncbi:MULTISPECIES: Rrf2 family transcriptional regulator [Exiguobacterium]|uniref:RrF2 family transcriptional regulator n=1 Tax=Exiguobacterium TaxID=33986 RepID=UPI001BEC7729|nr:MULTISPECIES: Rrf2 family transcriptional regulator [Exiguobacterium]